jgi:hypothetical protein
MAVVENVQFGNFYTNILAANAGVSDTTMTLANTTGLPSISGNQYFYLTIIRDSDKEEEIVKVTAVTGTLFGTITCVRAQEGTSALALVSGDAVELNFTAAVLDDLRDEITAELNKLNFADASLATHHDTSVANSIAKIVNDAAGNEVAIHLGPGSFIFTSDYTIPVGVTLYFEGNSQLYVKDTSTLTIAGTIIGPRREIITAESGSTLSVTSGQDLLAEWFSAVSYATTGEGSPVNSGEKIDDLFGIAPSSRIILTDGYYYCTDTRTIGTDTGSEMLVFKPGAYLYSDAGTVTLSLKVDAGRYKIFEDGAGAFKDLQNGVIYPEWFGAIADGSTDSTTAIQMAVDVAGNNGSAPTTIDFTGNNYYNVTDDITVSSPRRFINGEIWKSTTTGRAIFLLSAGASGSEFHNLNLNMSIVSSGNCSGIFANTCNELVISHVNITRPRADTYATANYDAGVYLYNCNRCQLNSVLVYTPTKSGIALEECDNTVVTGGVVTSPTLVGVDVFNGNYNTISNFHVRLSSDMGIRAAGLTTGEGSLQNVTFSDCVVDSSTQEGIVIDGATADCENVIIKGCTLNASSVSYTGIEFRGTVTDAMAVANHIEGYDYGVGTTGATSNLLVAVNHLMGCTTETTIHSSSTNTQVLSNMKGATLTEAHAIITEDLATTAAGTGGSPNTWAARKCNKIEADTAGMVASIDGGTGEFDLVAGTYKIRAFCPVTDSDGTQSRIYDVTNSKVIANGLSVTSNAGGDNDEFNISIVSGILSIGSTTTLRIETIASNDWISCNALSSVNITNAERSIGTLVEITKISTQAISTVDLSGENHVSYELDASGGIAIGTHKIGELPDNAVVTRAWYEVITTFTDGASDTATIGFDIEGDDPLGAAGEGILEAIAINDVSNPFDDGGGGPPVAPAYYDAIQDGAVGNFAEKTTQVRDVRAIVGTAALTAGHLFLHLTFTVSE